MGLENIRTEKLGTARIGLAAIAILLCSVLAVNAARHGLARYAYGSKGAKATIADFERAIRLDDNDPDQQLMLANALGDAQRNQEAIKHCERAVSLRPSDQFYWLELGYLRKLGGDLEGARQAFAQAVTLAPYYGQPHWRLGKCLVDMERRDEGFAELRTAVRRRPSYLGAFIELAWNSNGDDPKAMEDAIRPDDSRSNIAVAGFLADKGSWEDAVHFYHRSGAAGDGYLRGMVRSFIDKKRYLDAYRVWQTNHASGPNQCLVERGCLYDAGFEVTDKLEDSDFVWCVAAQMDSAGAEIDGSVANSGKRSLRIDYHGDSSTSAQLVSQLVLVRPSSRYQLTFRVKTKDLKSIALPIFSIIDTGLASKVAESPALPLGTADWRGVTLEFTTLDHTDAVTLVLSRTACEYADCPIFGTVWLDDFAIEKR